MAKKLSLIEILSDKDNVQSSKRVLGFSLIILGAVLAVVTWFVGGIMSIPITLEVAKYSIGSVLGTGGVLLGITGIEKFANKSQVTKTISQDSTDTER